MTLFQIVQALKGIALTSPYIRTAEEGSIYDIMNANPHIKYGTFVISQTNHRQDELFDYYGFNIFVCDRLKDDLESNRLHIQSTAKEVLANTILTFCTDFYGITHNELNFIPFTEKFVDLTAGQYVQVTFRVPKALNCPDRYMDKYGPDYRLQELVVTVTENGIYEYEPNEEDYDGYSKATITVNVPSTGHTDEELEKAYEDGKEDGIEEQKSKLISTAFTENGTYTREDGYSGITVNVPQTGHTDEELEQAYEDGKKDQKALLEDITISNNGEYQTENGYGKVTVNVPQTGTTINNQSKTLTITQNGEQTVTYDSGYTGLEKVVVTTNISDRYNEGKSDGIEEQKAKLISTTFIENGTYTRTDGYSGITVNVDTQTPYDNGYSDGEAHQKSLLVSTAFTENGTYTRENGYSAVTVNVPTSISFHRLTIDFSKNTNPSELINVVVTVTNSSGSTNYTYTGNNININLYPGVNYTISYGSVAGKTTPSSNSLTTTWGGSTTLYPIWNESETLTVSPTSYTFVYSGGNTTIMVQSNTGWTVTSKPDWVTLSSSSGSGNKTITATTTSTSAYRSGTIVFKTNDSGITRNITVEQTENYTPKGDKTDYLTISAITNGTLYFISHTMGQANFMYSINGKVWQKGYSSSPGPHINLKAGDIVRFKGNICAQTNCNYSNLLLFTAKDGLTYNIIGNIMSMVDGYNFSGLTSLSSYEGAFQAMFDGLHNDLNCGAINASGLILPATTLSKNCYRILLSDQRSLISTPKLPATTLADSCYYAMFSDCESLTTTPTLPATTLADGCYNSMFSNCTGLTTAPTLPATTLADSCYYEMFSGCTSLTTAPSLPATTLTTNCYGSMFYGCSKLNYIKCLATNISATDCLLEWVRGVASSGTFYKKSSVTYPSGRSGIPSGWTIQNV